LFSEIYPILRQFFCIRFLYCKNHISFIAIGNACIGGVFCLATANAQNRCEFLELLYDLATAEDCRDVWDYFHGHPLPHVREFHQRLCVEFDGADYNDPIVQDALMRLMREAGMYGWLVMGQVAMPEDADDWHSGFAYAETFEQAMVDILQLAERAREARA